MNTENEIKVENAAEAIRTALKQENMSQTALSDRIGLTRQSISQSLTRATDIRVETFKKIVEGLGYEVIIRKK